MRISIVNITKRLQVDLLSSSEYERDTGYNPNTHNYSLASATTEKIWLQSWSGLMSGGSLVSNTTLKAINTNGEYFAGNSWGPTTFSIQFKALNDATFQKLNECIKYKNEPLYVQVTTDKTYYMWCIVDDGSGIEVGELTFISALDGTGTYWSTGDEDLEWSLKGGNAHALVQSGPQNLLGGLYEDDEEYDIYTLSRFITAEQLPIITVECPFISFQLEHVNSGVTYTDNPEAFAGPQNYVFNSRDMTTTYNGELVDYTTDYIRFTGGQELLKLKVTKGQDVSDIKINITYEKLYSTVFGG